MGGGGLAEAMSGKQCGAEEMWVALPRMEEITELKNRRRRARWIRRPVESVEAGRELEAADLRTADHARGGAMARTLPGPALGDGASWPK